MNGEILDPHQKSKEVRITKESSKAKSSDPERKGGALKREGLRDLFSHSDHGKSSEEGSSTVPAGGGGVGIHSEKDLRYPSPRNARKRKKRRRAEEDQMPAPTPNSEEGNVKT